ncbi:MAG: dehydrogenase subunit [Edaphobacter sp.]|nr:dehydrogenase subunit [Edaphobacter sp.]
MPGEVTLPFFILGVLTIVGAAAALTLRNLVHCVLALILAFLGLSGLYLQLDAQFIGFAQILVYIGAVAILIVFAILLTRGAESPSQPIASPSWAISSVVSVAVFGVLAWTIRSSVATRHPTRPQPELTVRQIGNALMSRFALPLEVIGLLLTAALVGAVTIAMQDKREMK